MKGFVIAGTGSGVGKTSIATGLMSALSRKYKVQAFKAGPDFIDPMYHTAATGRPSRNLDSFMMDEGCIRNLVGYSSKDADLCIVEGVRGLYEGFSGDGDIGSTAYLAKTLGLPVVLVVNAGSLTRSAAAIINGFRDFDPDVKIAGVILNKVSGSQHSDKLDLAMRTYCKGVKLLGKIRKDSENTLEQRYLGLATLHNYDQGNIVPLERLVDTVDLDMLVDIAESFQTELPDSSPYVSRKSGLRAAVPYDDAYCFLYRENVECMQASGIDVKFFSPVKGDSLPDADMAYLCGGYPELFADKISDNKDYLEGLKQMSDEGKPILGECGGMMTLCKDMKVKSGEIYRMAGCFDATADMVGKRHGPTYVIADATPDNPLFSGTVKGHEYHYSEVQAGDSEFCFSVRRGQGISGKMDGMFRNRTVGTYLHQHALSHEDWAKGFVDSCQ